MILETLERAGLRAEVTHHDFDPLDPFWYTDDLGAASSFAGFPIGPDTSLRVSTVFACTSLIAESIASLPCTLMRRTDDEGGMEKARDHRWYNALRWRPNRGTPAINFYANGQMDLGLRGKAMFKITDNGVKQSLRPLNTATTRVEEVASGLRYHHWNPVTQREEVFLQDEILHIRDLSFNGDTDGKARATLAREAIAVAAAGEAFVGGFFKNDASGRLVFTHPGQLGKPKRDEFMNEVRKNWSGWKNHANPMMTWGGVDIKELGMRGEGDFIVGPRQFQAKDIARFWRVPGFMIGLEEKSTSWGTGIAEQKNGFVTFTLKPWTDRWVQAMQLALLDEEERDEFVIEFNFDDLLRPDLLQRMKAHEIAIRSGVINSNEARRVENRNEREGGDKFQDTPPGTAPTPPPPTEPPEDGTEAHSVPAPLLLDAAQRIAGAEVQEIERRVGKAEKDPEKWRAWITKHCRAQRDFVFKVLGPLAVAYGFDALAGIAAVAYEIESSALAVLEDGVPDGWIIRRATEVAGILESHLGEKAS